MRSFCVLLTATVDPGKEAFTRRSDPKKREEDYIKAIRDLASLVDYPIVFVENSEYDLKKIRDTLERYAPGRHEVIQEPKAQELTAKFGKGYGEMQLIKHAVSRSRLIKESDHLIKITGRYTILNLKEIIDSLPKDEDFFVSADFARDAKYAYSGIFICKPAFINSYLLPLENSINDFEGQNMEVVLRSAIRNAERDGRVCVQFETLPKIDAVSGTWNAKIKEDDPLDVEFSFAKLLILKRRIKPALARRRQKLKDFAKKLYTSLTTT